MENLATENLNANVQNAAFHQFFDRHAGAVVLLDGLHQAAAANPAASHLLGALDRLAPFSTVLPEFPQLFHRWSSKHAIDTPYVEIGRQYYQLEITALDTGEFLLIFRDASVDQPEQNASISNVHTSVMDAPETEQSDRANEPLTDLASASISLSSQQFYETILSNTPDLIYVFDLDHRFIYANKILLEMWGLSWEQAIGKNCLQLGYEPWHAEMHDKEIELVKSTKQPLQGEVPFNGAFGRRVYHYIFTPLIGPDGEVQAIAGTTRDITERHETEETLRLSREALQMADRRKDEFLAMLAHELRNPLAPISAAAQIMVLGSMDEQRVKRSSQIIDRQVRHMVGLIDDLLDVSRVTRGLVVIDKSPQDIKAVISNSIEQVRPMIESKHHHLLVELDSQPAVVMGDYKRLVQIVSNVLNNAAKYTPDGGKLHIKMNVVDGSVVLAVIDNGIGVAEDERLEIFDLFAQAKRSSDRSQGGLGIGLALVTSILKLHDGNIVCSSRGMGLGSEFIITLPLVQDEKQAAAVEDQGWSLVMGVRPLNILVVDDNVDAAMTLANLLKLIGHEVSVEHDAQKALHTAAVQLPEVCILDIGLPDMDGNELARHLRSTPSTASSKLIAVTGYGQEHDRKAAMAAGFDYHMVKPVDIGKLTSLLADISKA